MKTKVEKSNKALFVMISMLFLSFLLINPVSAAIGGLGKECTDLVDSTDCPAGQKCVTQEIAGTTKNRCARALEVIYPTVPGQTSPQTVAEGIPQYFRYIFLLSISAIGLMILGVFIYYGTRYLSLSATGNVSGLTDAKQGISAAFLGTAILVGSYIIFTTINPQLKVLELPPITLLEQVVSPGVYVCNYAYSGNSVTAQAVTDGIIPADDIGSIISSYINKTGEEQIEVTKVFESIIVNPDNRDETCSKANFSGNFQNFVVQENNTMFVIPSIRFSAEKNPTPTDPNNYDYIKKPLYEYGVVLHEKDDFAGKCIVMPGIGQIYTGTTIDSEERIKIEDAPYNIGGAYSNPIMDFKAGSLINQFNKQQARSITIFKRPAEDVFSGAKGLVAHMCIAFDQTSCPEAAEDPNNKVDQTSGKPTYDPNPPNFPPPAAPIDVQTYDITDLDATDVSIKNGGGIRSVKIDPKNLSFAILRDDENNCAVVKVNNPDIANIGLKKCDVGVGNIGHCDRKGWLNLWYAPYTGKCIPCITKIEVFKGQAL